MNHLSNEQMEEVLQGRQTHAEHLQTCQRCADQLAEKRAMAKRLRVAFDTINAPEGLAERFSSKIAAESIRIHGSRIKLFPHWRAWTAAAAALIVIPVLVMLAVPSRAMAAKAELVNIHTHNVAGNHEFYSQSDPDKLAAYFKENLGFTPSLPRLGQGMEIRGCCVRHFRDRIVGSYVVDTPRGVMSVIVVTDEPQTLGMSKPFEYQGKAFYKSTFAQCDLVAVRLDKYTYCAVGEISSDYLTELLARLLAEEVNHAN